MKNQNGATLIVVLVLLLVITVIGTLAIKNSVVGLSIATNSQAQQLLLQNADSAFFSVEKEENLIQSLTTSGMFGYISGAENKDKELVFCYMGDKADFFDINRASIMQWEGGQSKPTANAMGMDGYCSTSTSTTSNFFTSGRKAVITQVAVKYSTQSDADPFYGMQFGSDEKGVKFEKSKPVKVFAVSIMPALSTADRSKIDTCLNARMNEVSIPDGTTKPSKVDPIEDDPTKSVTECLSGLNVPYTSHATEYVIAQDFT